ncbi:M20 family metallopeptidase [Granulicella sp. dw_53]|uniref:M20 family metallopeptidase n=1 Tax=Granulicella sp. dw_53 TaxID=2719792 RepID=UPI001BD38BB1|nr:M20 family metallopeptidase [Granulicella sp. dw_53]
MAPLDPQALLAHLETRRPWIVSHLRELVLQESPSEDPATINAAMALAEGWARELGGRAKYHKQREFGHVLELRFGPTRSQKKPILLLGHLDTVWPLGTLANMPWKESATKIEGPGTLDMKAGVVMALAAIEALKALKINRPITVLLNSEEEIGSPVSRPITERLALESSAVLVLEPAQGLALKTARKGVGHYLVEVTGVAAHSGVDFEAGHSAILELARLIQTISAFTDLDRKLTVNCGVISGGTRSNVVAAHAQVEVDVRIAKTTDARHVEKLFRSLKTTDPRCTLKITGGINRPPMERKPGTIALFKQAKQLAGRLGFSLEESSTGGGSDGNFTAALGVPTLDGMGAIGAGAHAPHEHILTEHLIPRTALLAAMLATLD